MSQGFEGRFREGRALRRMRSEHTIPGSPCERCRRDWCPRVCYPRMDYDKGRREKAYKEGRYGR